MLLLLVLVLVPVLAIIGLVGVCEKAKLPSGVAVVASKALAEGFFLLFFFFAWVGTHPHAPGSFFNTVSTFLWWLQGG